MSHALEQVENNPQVFLFQIEEDQHRMKYGRVDLVASQIKAEGTWLL